MRNLFIITNKHQPSFAIVGKLSKEHQQRLEWIGYDLKEVVLGRRYPPPYKSRLTR